MTRITLENALKSNAWPFKEAAAILERYKDAPPAKGYVLFETGYGPSGLPHIGTFAEVFRTTMVRQAFQKLSDIPTRLFAFSDDMDGLRKVPDNIPQPEMVAKHLGKPLTAIPDPFGTHDSYGAHMNARLRQFLDAYNFEYEFKSSTECYKSGMFDKALLAVLKHYDKVMKVMIPTLGEERQQSYSPFLPLDPISGLVLQVPMVSHDTKAGTAVFKREDGSTFETPVTGGACKLQWKPDWGMRWAALGVDYEMHGKDLTPSAELSRKICEIITPELDGTPPPVNFVYEMFLDEAGAKISKSKGNGLTLEEWLKYGPPESLAAYLYNSPQKAKRLHFDVIPKSMDEYLSHLEKLGGQEDVQKFANPVWHIHNAQSPEKDIPITFALLLNLAAACNPEDKSVLWGFISSYAPTVTPKSSPLLDKLAGYALAYYNDFVKPNKHYRLPDATERSAMEELLDRLHKEKPDTSPEELQNIAFEVGKGFMPDNLRGWFQCLYEVLLGQSQGPRVGSFIALYGVARTITLMEKALDGAFVPANTQTDGNVVPLKKAGA